MATSSEKIQGSVVNPFLKIRNEDIWPELVEHGNIRYDRLHDIIEMKKEEGYSRKQAKEFVYLNFSGLYLSSFSIPSCREHKDSIEKDRGDRGLHWIYWRTSRPCRMCERPSKYVSFEGVPSFDMMTSILFKRLDMSIGGGYWKAAFASLLTSTSVQLIPWV